MIVNDLIVQVVLRIRNTIFMLLPDQYLRAVFNDINEVVVIVTKLG